MQRFRIQHVTEYVFPSPVTLNGHRLMLRPREGHDVRIESSKLDISPRYAIKWYRDVFDNSVALVHFMQPSDRLRIVSDVVIQHYGSPSATMSNDFYPANNRLDYEPDELIDLAVYQRPMFSEDQPALKCWLHEIGLGATELTIPRLQSTLNHVINRQFQYQVREEAGVQSPRRTLNLGSGSCRDYATLFIEASRTLGLASRFVSGYLHAPATEAGNASTHAWAEVYFPGLGWQGFDPTIGNMTADSHIAVAVARNPEAIPPISGSYIGPDRCMPGMFVNVQVNLLRY